MDEVLKAVAGLATPLVGIFGVVIGAGVTAALSRRNDARRVVTDIRREVYFETMDLAVAQYEQLSVLGANGPRGGEDPEADTRASEAIGSMMNLRAQFVRTEARVATVGSPTVTEATFEFRKATDDYLKAVFEQHGTGQLFRVGIAARHFGNYAATLDRLARAIRADLGLAPLASTLPVTRQALERVSQLAPAAWYRDPTERYELRWWNGSYWDDSVIRGGQRMNDPEPVHTSIE